VAKRGFVVVVQVLILVQSASTLEKNQQLLVTLEFAMYSSAIATSRAFIAKITKSAAINLRNEEI